ncbi:L-threonylcarbamoyladenylate synthase [Rothia sp. AR01]|uniref:L-threonylcarbamoyladenylate synthase n=1 Tax=Rothia santali TaxID=2949643 RepID=A0A9X2KLB3_9MICC|nr:L-threonylcarbamoyladenylate synthase [Rothia santali]MCP3425951.1 L-threonylcarbamoyladenylate synthase [Rothia santali]
MTATVYSVTSPDEREAALEAATAALSAGRTVVIPTDTVYGIAADAFSRGGVRQLLAAKGRSRRMPPPVLIADPGVLPGLADDVGEQARALAEAFWPGALTLIVYAQPSLNWDLGETSGTVGLRVPDDELARELLRRTGPLAVSSANRTGRAAATDAGEALEQLGERVEAILDDGPRPVGRAEGVASADVAPSTIVDATGDHLVVVRLGAISMERLREVAPDVVTREELRERRRASAAPTAAETGEDLVAGSSAPSGSTVAAGSAGSAGVAAASAGSAAGAASARPVVDQMRSRPEGEDGRRPPRGAPPGRGPHPSAGRRLGPRPGLRRLGRPGRRRHRRRRPRHRRRHPGSRRPRVRRPERDRRRRPRRDRCRSPGGRRTGHGSERGRGPARPRFGPPRVRPARLRLTAAAENATPRFIP